MKSVQVLLSTYNGEKYLREQLDSLLNQIGVVVKITVRDDGSTDNTVKILEEYSANNMLNYSVGKNVGYKKSFLLLSNSSIGKADYYAYCDQDDYWEPLKLVTAVNMLENCLLSKYKLYFSNLKIVNEDLIETGIKDFSAMPKTLGSVMTRSNVAGCTMVFNEDLLKLSLRRREILNGMFSHDSWIYKVCLSVGGGIIFDPNSYIRYRQHGQNVTGIKQGIFERFKTELKGLTTERNTRFKSAVMILNEYENLIPKDNINLLTEIISYKNNFYSTVKLMLNKKLRFNNFIIDLLSRFAILIRRY